MTQKSPPYQASKWIEIPALLSLQELSDLFETLQPIYLFHLGKVINRGESKISLSQYLEEYKKYLNCSQNGSQGTISTSVLTTVTNAVEFALIGADREIVRIREPVIQITPHSIDYSPVDQKIRSNVRGINTIPWGVQFSFPQLYYNPTNQEVEKVLRNNKYPNAELFKKLQKWIRQNTLPTPFLLESSQVNSPIKIGKECLEWVQTLPQLKQKKIGVAHVTL